jgi:hypothetical protein
MARICGGEETQAHQRGPAENGSGALIPASGPRNTGLLTMRSNPPRDRSVTILQNHQRRIHHAMAMKCLMMPPMLARSRR